MGSLAQAPSLDRMPLLQTPGPAPDFSTAAFVNNAIGNVSSQTFKDKKYVVILFYPMDFLFSEPLMALSARAEEFNKMDAEVMVMSTDSVYSHKAFAKASKADGGMEGKFKLAMLADRSGKICKKFGVFDAEEGVARKALVVIDPTGTARHMVATSLTMDRLIDDTLKALATFQGKAPPATATSSSSSSSAFPNIRSKHSLVAKHVTKDKWDK